MANQMEMSKLKPIGRWLRLLIVVAGLTALLGGGYAAWRYFDVPPLDRYAPLIAQIAARQIDGDALGRIDLSKKYPGLTPKDVAYITRREDKSFVLMFPTFYGEGTQVAGLIYTSRPLRDEDTTPRTESLQFGERVISVGSYQYLIVDKQINPNWYHVSYHIH